MINIFCYPEDIAYARMIRREINWYGFAISIEACLPDIQSGGGLFYDAEGALVVFGPYALEQNYGENDFRAISDKYPMTYIVAYGEEVPIWIGRHEGVVIIDERDDNDEKYRQLARNIFSSLGDNPEIVDRLKTLPRKAVWGPGRKLFSNNRPAAYPVFNSITNNSAIGNETNFLRIRELDVGFFGDTIRIFPGKKYQVRIYYQNDTTLNSGSLARPDGLALDTKVRSGFPEKLQPYEWDAISAIIWSSTTEPPAVWDGCNIWSSEPVRLRCDPSSLQMSNRELELELPFKEFFSSEGALIGYKALDGIIPGDTGEYASGCITYVLEAESYTS